MDYQNGIMGRVENADALLARAKRTIGLIRGHGATIGYVRVGFADGEAPSGSTDLDEQLEARGVDTLILAGISTSGVVLTTVRDGHDRDYRLIVLSDLCADPETDVHQFLTERIFPRQAEVITSEELPGLLG